MPKRFFIAVAFLCAIFGIVGNSYAECVLTKSTDRTPSDEDLYLQKPDESRMALICEKGKCEDGEMVYVGGTHYIGNIFNSEGFTTVNKGAYYKCKLGGNDRWLEAQPSDIRTTSSYIAPTDERPMIEYDDNKGLFVYGTKATDGVYYKNLLYVEPDEKCGVKCTPENGGKSFFCDDGMFYCNPDTYKFTTDNPIVVCGYTTPEQLDGQYNNLLGPVPGAESFSAFLLDGIDPKTGFTSDQICLGCSSGYYSSFSIDKAYECVNDKDEAWCNWRRNKESKNTEWKDGHCECLDKGKEWNTETHDCVETKGSGKTGTGKTSGGKTGGGSSKTGSGSGKTGSGSGKTGGKTGNKTEVCGVKCNAQNSGKYFYCDNKIYWCSYDGLNGSFDLDDRYGIAGFCEYSEPAIRTGMLKTSSGNSGDNYIYEYKLDGTVLYNKITDYDGGAIYGNEKTKSLKNGGEITHSMLSGFCLGCASGFFYGSYSCHKSEDKAWCYWQKDNNLNTEWQNGECKCLDDGMKWNPATHNCIADGKGDSGDSGKDKKITVAKCAINIAASVKCRQNTTFSGTVELDLSPEICEKYKTTPNEHLYEIARELCADFGGVASVLSDADIQDAQKRIDKFLHYSESNTSVWKNADGKFNTARLASDATAGVILGTVGGIVSAHIIKKKQVEKGFDALNCAIGGQKVADWGDEFRVGFGAR